MYRALIFANLTSCAAAIGAAAVMYSGHLGWGWLLFLACVTHTSEVKITTSTGEGDGR